MPSSLLPKTPTPKVIVWTQSRRAGDCTLDFKTPPKRSPCLCQLAHLPPVPTPAAPLEQLVQTARPAARGPLPAHRALGEPHPRPRPPPARAAAPPARVLAHSPPRPPPAAPPPPHPTHPTQPGTPAHPTPPGKEGAAATQRLPPGRGRPGGRAPKQRGLYLRDAAASSEVGPGRGRHPPVLQSAAAGAAAAAHHTRRRPEKESEPRREGASEAGGRNERER